MGMAVAGGAVVLDDASGVGVAGAINKGDADGTVVAVGTVVVIAVGLGAAGDDPAGVGPDGLPAHAASIIARRRDAARRFAFICRRRFPLGFMARCPRPGW
jgi:hypothetical protein